MALILITGSLSILTLVGLGVYYTIRFTKENEKMEGRIR